MGSLRCILFKCVAFLGGNSGSLRCIPFLSRSTILAGDRGRFGVSFSSVACWVRIRGRFGESLFFHALLTWLLNGVASVYPIQMRGLFGGNSGSLRCIPFLSRRANLVIKWGRFGVSYFSVALIGGKKGSLRCIQSFFTQYPFSK